MTITALPTTPARSDPPATFITLADAFLAALPTFATEANAAALAMNLNATSDTSASSVAIGTGAKVFTVSAGKSFLGGMWLVIADTAAPSTNWMMGQVTSYSSTTLTMNIVAMGGSGTKTAWTISQSVPMPANEARGSVAMHATTMNPWAQPNLIDGTGSPVTVTAIANAPQAGARRTLYPIAGSIITHGATFAVDGAASATASAGDKWEIEAVTTSTYKVHITKKDGAAVTGSKVCDFRLTLTSGLPVTTADVTGATTIYCTPYKGNLISLYDGAAWVTRASAQFSLALGTLTSGKPYDVFAYDNAGVPTLEFLTWTNDTTRATALAYQDGVLVKSGAATRRYLGTFYTTATTTTEDSAAKRYLWNYYHRALRPMVRKESTASWTYTTATWRQANAAAANQLDCILGVAEDAVKARVMATASNAGSNRFSVGIGLDSTSANSATLTGGGPPTTVDNVTEAEYSGILAAGRHYLAWLEWSTAANTTTWLGVDATTTRQIQSGIVGEVFA